MSVPKHCKWTSYYPLFCTLVPKQTNVWKALIWGNADERMQYGIVSANDDW